MNLLEWLDKGEDQLRSGPHPDRARRDAETLLLHLIGKNRAWLLAHREDDFAGCKAIGYAALLSRRQKGEPLQYITGETEFYGLPFRVTPDVLIPRPETEHLVEKVLELAANLGAPSLNRFAFQRSESGQLESSRTNCRILDIGTGSGAIAIALAHALPYAQVTAADISASALAIAQQNAARNSVSVRFLQGDLLAPISSQHFDLIVSNPPYVPITDRPSLSVEVRDYEPALALFAGNDGLDIYRRLIPTAFAALAPGGYLALEIGYGQQSPIESLLVNSGFAGIEFTPDLQGIPRVASARHP
ncbi:MAG: peptide chain release factor N(5)-glutamine methyltransferase [Terracidiphilus sp.]